MEDLLRALMQGGQQQSRPEEAGPGDDPFAQLLQDFMGGQASQDYAAQAKPDPIQGEMDLGGLLQGILGGTGQAPTSGAGECGDILGAIMGGGSPFLESDTFLAPIVTGLAEKLGLPPQVAQAVAAFVLGKLAGHRLQPDRNDFGANHVSGRPASGNKSGGRGAKNEQWQEVKKAGIRSAGLAEELAAHTGKDRATAEASLHEVLNALGGQLGAGK